jgi:predicted Zn-dependent protease
MASLFAYSREQETEADKLGFGRAVAAGYDRTAPQRVWAYEIAESQASDFPDIRKSDVRASIFATHPLDAQRLDALRTLAGGPASVPEVTAERSYRDAIRPHLGDWLKDDLRRRDFGETLFLIDHLAQLGDDMGLLEFYRAEALRQRRGPGDAAAALKSYQAAVEHPDAPAAAWRELGEALRKAGDQPGAGQAFAAYVAKAPEADDRWVIEAELKRLSGGPTK